MKKTVRISVIIFLTVAFVTIMQSCEKKSAPPKLFTSIVTGITQISAESGGFVTDDGGAEVVSRGICWSTSPNPTTSSDKTTNGAGTGSFTSIIDGLTANTTYYVRAYAINSEGTSYGYQYTFTTKPQGDAQKKSEFPGGSRFGATSFSIGTKIYIGLGFDENHSPALDFWEYETSANSWTRKADFPGNSTGGAVSFSIGTKGYIGTGYTHTGGFTNEFWEYEPETNTWVEKASFPGPARADGIGFSIGAKGYIGTGFTSNTSDIYSYYQDLWEWDQATNTWVKKADFKGSGRSGAVGFSIGTKGYIGTGYDGNVNNSYSNDFWEWDQSTNTWTRKADFGGSGRFGAVGFSIGTRGYIGTGYVNNENTSYSDDFWEWDQTMNEWLRKADLEGDVRYLAVGVSAGDKGYIGTGFGGILATDSYLLLSDFWEFDPN